MRLITVGGFLGAGKTSLLQGLAQWWGLHGRRVLVLENEAGQVGLDDRLLREFKLEVRTLPGGCACCDLQGVLVDRLKQARAEGVWDLLLLEPSGVASLGSLRQCLDRYLPELGSGAMVAVVDANRYSTMRKALPKLVADHLAAASQVVLSKVDLIEPAEAHRLRHELGLDAPHAQVWAADLRGRGAQELAREVAHRLLETDAPSHASQAPAGDGAHQAQSYALSLPGEGLSLEQARNLVSGLIAALMAPEQGMLGHIKLWGGDARGRNLLVGGTTPQDLSARGGSPGPLVGRAWLVVISHSPLPANVDRLVAQELRAVLPGASVEPVRATPSLQPAQSLARL